MHFPTSGRQKEFETGFAAALEAIGWSKSPVGDG
jgi:hypothetical protein